MLPILFRIPFADRLAWTKPELARWCKEAALACATAGFAFHDPVFDIAPTGDTQDEMFLKSADAMFWRRKVTQRIRIEHEQQEKHAGRIGKGAEHAYSGQTAADWSEHKAECRASFLKSSVVFDHATGVSTSLQSLVQTEQDKAARYYAILMGLQTLAADAGLNWAMLTITLPSEWHANPATKRKSHHWNGKNAAEAHKVIADGWKRLRAVLAKKGITLSGVRTEEPQQDGTPHWHCAFFYNDEAQLQQIARATLLQFPAGLRICRGVPGKGKKLTKKQTQYATLADFDAGKTQDVRKGAQCQIDVGTAKTGNPETDKKIQSFASYILKYVSKTVGVETGEAGDTPAEKVKQHRETYGIRQIQFYGLPTGSLTCWDLLRQVDLTETDPDLAAPPGIAFLANITQQDKGLGMPDYLRALGGLSVAPLPALYSVTSLKEDTVTKYRGKGFKLMGIQCQTPSGPEAFVIKHGQKEILRSKAAQAVFEAMGKGDAGAVDSFFDAAVSGAAGLVQLSLTVTADELAKDAATADASLSHTIIAAAGSGKTSLLVARAKYLVRRCNVSPADVVIATFTNEAVETITRRLAAAGLRGVQVGTMHSLSGRWLSAAGVSAQGFDDAIQQAIAIAEPRYALLLDEAQDLSADQWAWANAWAETLYSVGDDRQAIYGWRGASAGGLLAQAARTAADHVQPDFFNIGGAIDMSYNRRSASAIVALGNAIATGSTTAKALREGGDITRYKASTVREETAQLVEWAKAQTGSAAVLARTNVEVSRIKAEFMLAGLSTPVLTVHASKGDEWDTVALACGHRDATEDGAEAKEVFYVAATRAKEAFHITSVGQLPQILHNALAICKGRAP